MKKQSWQLLGWLLLLTCPAFSQTKKIDVLVLGGGTGGTAAAIQSARLGAKTWLVGPSGWLGGVSESNGPSVVRSNRQMPAGLWGEIRLELRKRLEEEKKTATGPNGETRFESKIWAEIFEKLASAEAKKLTIFTNSDYRKISKIDSGWKVELLLNGHKETVETFVLVDGTTRDEMPTRIKVYPLYSSSKSDNRTIIAVSDLPIHRGYASEDEFPLFGFTLGEFVEFDESNFVRAEGDFFVGHSPADEIPLLLQIGQTAGIVASLAALTKKPPSALPVRMIQSFMLSAGGYLMPFLDVPKSHPAFAAIQKIGATGLLRGDTNMNFQPDSLVRREDFLPYLMEFYPENNLNLPKTGLLTPGEANLIFRAFVEENFCEDEFDSGGGSCTAVKFENTNSVKRWELALWLDRFLDPFAAREVDFQGNFLD